MGQLINNYTFIYIYITFGFNHSINPHDNY